MAQKMESNCFGGWHAFKISEEKNEANYWEYSYTLFIDNA
jgi:hypothetical protein